MAILRILFLPRNIPTEFTEHTDFLLRSVDSVGGFSQAEGSVNSVGSVGDQRTLTICVDLRNLWEVLPKQKVL